MEQDQLARLAAAGNALRPDWPAASLRTFLGKNFGGRTYADVALVLAKVATDPKTETPRLMLEGWPWQVTRPVSESEASRHTSSVPLSQLCDHCGRNEDHCQEPAVQAEDPHEFVTPAVRRARAAKAKPATEANPNAKPYVNPELRAGIRADITTAKAALTSSEADWQTRRRPA